MDAAVFIRQMNATQYRELGIRHFSALPRVDEFISADVEGGKKYFQVVAVHHAADDNIELYAVQTEPSWEIRKGRAIGFGN
jgi:hypothetical protein